MNHLTHPKYSAWQNNRVLKTKGTEDMSDTKQKNKIDPCIWLDDAPDKHEGGWRNLVFDINGKSYLGCKVHLTQKEARDDVIDAERGFESAKYAYMGFGSSVKLKKDDYSHAIQIPVKEKP